MRFLTAVALALVMLWVPVDGVAQEEPPEINIPDRIPLKGLTYLDPEVSIAWHDNIRNQSERQYTQEVEMAFELGLRRAGLNIDYPPFLDEPKSFVCAITLVADGVGVAGSVEVHLIEIGTRFLGRSENVGVQGVKTWAKSMMFMLSSSSFLDGKEHGEWCAENFELEWRRANN